VLLVRKLAAYRGQLRLGEGHLAAAAFTRRFDETASGRERQRRKIASSALADFQASKSVQAARTAIDRMMEKWNETLGLTVKPASNIAEATVHAQIRERLASMKEGRMAFLEKSAANPVVASAILTAPHFLSGLSDAELALVTHKVERNVSLEMVEARDATIKAMQEVVDGWQRAQNAIAQRAGLVKGMDGTWSEASDEAA